MLILFTCSAFLAMWGQSDLEAAVIKRKSCHANCQTAHFPLRQKCAVRTDLATLRYQGNTYSRFFRFERPPGANILLDTNGVSLNVSSSEVFSKGVNTLSDFQQCLAWAELEPLAYSAGAHSCTASPVHDDKFYIEPEGRCERIDVCFRDCQLPAALRDEMLANATTTAAAANTNSNAVSAGGSSSAEVENNSSANATTTTTGAPSDKQETVVASPEIIECPDGRRIVKSQVGQLRSLREDILSTLSWEKEYPETSTSGAIGGTSTRTTRPPPAHDRRIRVLSSSEEAIDTRPTCSSLESALHPAAILCVAYNTYETENAYWPGSLCFGDVSAEDPVRDFCVSASQVFLAICAANFLQFLMESLFVYLTILDEHWSVEEASRKCFSQFLVIFSHILMIMLCFGNPLSRASRSHKEGAIWLCFFLALVGDQLKNLLIQPVIWWVVIRRFGRVYPGIQEYNEEYLRIANNSPPLK